MGHLMWPTWCSAAPQVSTFLFKAHVLSENPLLCPRPPRTAHVPGTSTMRHQHLVLPPGCNPLLQGGVQLGAGGTSAPVSQLLWLPVRPSAGPSFLQFGCPWSPWQRALPAAAASLARHFQCCICIPSLCLLLGAGSRPGQASISKQPLFYW